MLAAKEARERTLKLMSVFDTFAHSPNAIRAALEESARRRLSFWDAVLLASAAEAGCSAIMSEDMKDGIRLGSIVVVNPFAGGLSAKAQEIMS